MTEPTGRCFEDFAEGMVIQHELGRTINTADNTWFTLVTNNNNPIHFDRFYAEQTEFGQPLVNSTLTLAIIVGLTVGDVSKNGVNLGWKEINIPAPLYEGDTVYAQTEILSTRESKVSSSYGDSGDQNNWLQARWYSDNDLRAHNSDLQTWTCA